MRERKDAVKIEGRQYVVVDGRGLDSSYGVGDVATLVRDDGSSEPLFEFSDGETQWVEMCNVLLLAETEETAPTKPQSVTEFEVGTVYDDGTGDLLQLQEDGAKLRLFKDGDMRPTKITERLYNWTVATAEQTAEFNKRKLQYQLDNLEVGEVYAVSTVYYSWVIRVARIEGEKVWVTSCIVPEDGYFSGGGHITPNSIRLATASEIAELEAAEKEHGCEYKKPLVNSKGTVIEEGQYYYTKEWDTVAKILTTDDYSGKITELRYEDGVIRECLHIKLHWPYAEALVRATPEQIAEFKDAEAKANCKVKEGKQYKVTVKGTEITFEVYRVSRRCVTFKQQLVGGREYLETLPIDSYIWETAVEVE